MLIPSATFSVEILKLITIGQQDKTNEKTISKKYNYVQ